jgi:hypothetical protein
MERKISIVEYFYEEGGAKGHRCGYCKKSDTNISQGGKKISPNYCQLCSITSKDNITLLILKQVCTLEKRPVKTT